MISVVQSTPEPPPPPPSRRPPPLGNGRRLAEVVDVHAGLTPTVVDREVAAASEDDVVAAVREAGRLGRPVCVAGGRHAMGGQAFRIGGILVDTRRLERVLRFDPATGLVEVEAGVRWVDLSASLRRAQRGRPDPWTVAQWPAWSPLGTVGGAVSVNAHGLGLARPPLAADVEALRVVDAAGEVRVARRDLEPRLFHAVLGGHGLIGVVTAVTLRLTRRGALRVRSQIVPSAGTWLALLDAAREGALYGDAALCCDESSDDFLGRAVVTTHRPVDPVTPTQPTPPGAGPAPLPSDAARPFDRIAAGRLRLDDRTFGSGSLRLHAFPEVDAREQDEPIGAGHRATEILAEVCVPGPVLEKLLDGSRALLRDADIDVTRATVRLVDRDRDALWSWARRPWACLTLGLWTERTREGLEAATERLSAVAGLAVDLGGTFHPGFHRFASRELMDRAHPGFEAFLAEKLSMDPEERFQSDWYAHYRRAPAARA